MGVVGGTHTESRFVTVVDDDLPGMVVQAGPSLANPPRADGHVSELGARAIGTVRLTAQPVGSVTVALTSSDSSEGVVVGPSSLAFSGADWDTAKTFTVGGVGDGTDADGDATFSVVASATGSGDSLWAATAPAASASFVNGHIFVPVVDGSDPLLSPLLGWEVTLSGRYLLPNATVTFGGAAGNLTVLDDAEGPGTETFAATGVVTYRSAVVTTPVLAATAYVDVVWTNRDGGTAPLDAAFYYTEDCPYEGQWGRGLDCVDCPVGTCIGGRGCLPQVPFTAFLTSSCAYLPHLFPHPRSAVDRRRVPRRIPAVAAAGILEPQREVGLCGGVLRAGGGAVPGRPGGGLWRWVRRGLLRLLCGRVLFPGRCLRRVREHGGCGCHPSRQRRLLRPLHLCLLRPGQGK